MHDEYSFLRSQYEDIIRQCDFLLCNSTDPKVLSMANESKKRAERGLATIDQFRTNG